MEPDPNPPDRTVEYRDEEYTLICGDVQERWAAITQLPRDEWNSADGHRVHPVPLEDTEIVRPDDLIATEDGYTRVFEQIMALDSYIDWGSHLPLQVGREYHNLEVKTCNGEFVYTFDPSRDLTQSDVPSDLASLIDFSSEQVDQVMNLVLTAYESPRLFLFKHYRVRD